MSPAQAHIVRGPLLNPRSDTKLNKFADGAIVGDQSGKIAYVGDWAAIAPHVSGAAVRQSAGVILPPLVDAHIHIPQFPIRGRFLEGIGNQPEGGRLLAGLNRNVFPAEALCCQATFSQQVSREFLAGTLSQGVVGGAAYMTVHAEATRLALEILPETWSVGLVLMNQLCPPDLCTDQPNLERDITQLAQRFGRRFIVTDRFAPVVDSRLRQQASALAEKFGLRMQTHLNEQISEKEFVEQAMYPDAGSYTNVYRADGLLAREPILAHCIWMGDEELAMVAESPGTLIAHCPTSNILLGSGVMPLDRIIAAGIDYAICTDVGASPTTSLLAEASQFLTVHAGRSTAATVEAALYKITHAPAAALGWGDKLGTFEVGKPMSFIEVDVQAIDRLYRTVSLTDHADLRAAVAELEQRGLAAGEQADLLEGFVRRAAALFEQAVQRVTVGGREIWRRDLFYG
jgi:guanine deaminase